MLRCILVCVCEHRYNIEYAFNRVKTLDIMRKGNPRVGRFWVPNTFLKSYLNFEPISLVVRLKWFFLERTLYKWLLNHCKN